MFVVGVLIGFYLGEKKGYFKRLFSDFDGYKSIYYGKRLTLESDYRPIYLNRKANQRARSNSVNLSSSDYKVIEVLKNSFNPIEDEVYLLEDILEEERIDISEFLLDPLKYKGKKVLAKRMILLRGEKKEKKLIMYFLVRLNEKDYYLTCEIQEPERYKSEDFRIGYYYNVEFISSGVINKENVIVNIEPTGDKTEWASGLEAF